MILVRCDRCSKELHNPVFDCSGGGVIIVVLYQTGWEYFQGAGNMKSAHNNKHICPECVHEYKYGFLKAKPGAGDGQ